MKFLFTPEYFQNLSAALIDNTNVFQRLKSQYGADLIYIPSKLKYSSAIASLQQVYLICPEELIFNAFEELIDFMSLAQGKTVN